MWLGYDGVCVGRGESRLTRKKPEQTPGKTPEQTPEQTPTHKQHTNNTNNRITSDKNEIRPKNI